jgi:ATP phosphoribosyltransferase
LEGREKVMIRDERHEAPLPGPVGGLPAMRSPTVAPLYGDDGYAVKMR